MVLLTQKQLSKELQVSEVSLWKYRQQGMPYKALGARLLRYDLEEVMKWLESRERVLRPFPRPREDMNDNECWMDCFEASRVS